MAYAVLLATLLTLYVRPGDLNPALESYPFLSWLSALLGLSLVLSWMVRPTKPKWSPHFTWILGVWFAFVFSQVAHTYLEATISTFKGFFTNVFLVFAVALVLTSWRRVEGFATVWILSAAFLAIAGVVQYATGVGLGGQVLVKGRIQGVGIFGDPNDLALAFLIAVPLAHARFYSRGGLRKIIFFALAALFTYATFLTNSRGGIVSLLLVFFALSAHRFGPKLGAFVGTAIVLALLALGPSRVGEINSKEASAQGRIAAWSAGLQMLKSNPAVGVGHGLFLDHHELTAHNSFVLCFAETGLIGAFFWIGLLYVSILALRRVSHPVRSRASPQLLTYVKGTQIAFLGFLAGAFFLSRTYNVLLYLLIGFAAALYRLGVEEQPETAWRVTGKDRWRIAGLVVGGVIVTYVLVKTLAVWTSRIY